MKRKIHPHLKHFIHQIVSNELAPESKTKEYLWKEELLKEVQFRILSELHEITNQDELVLEIDRQINEIKKETETVLSEMQRILKTIPFEVLMKYKA